MVPDSYLLLATTVLCSARCMVVLCYTNSATNLLQGYLVGLPRLVCFMGVAHAVVLQ